MSERHDDHNPELPRTVDWPGSMVLIVTAARNIAGDLEVRISKHVDGGVHHETVWLTTPEDVADFVQASVGEVIGLRPAPDSAPSSAPDSAPRPTPDSAPTPPNHPPEPAPPEVSSPPPPTSASPRPPTS